MEKGHFTFLESAQSLQRKKNKTCDPRCEIYIMFFKLSTTESLKHNLDSFFIFVDLVSLEDGETPCTSQRTPGRPERRDSLFFYRLPTFFFLFSLFVPLR